MSSLFAEWAETLERCWGGGEIVEQLPGEYDLNFRVSGRRDAILKVMHQECDHSHVSMQVEMLRRIAELDPRLPVPSIIPTREGHLFAKSEDSSGSSRFVWMTQALPGRPLGASAPKSLQVLREIGCALGRMEAALEEFWHPGLCRELKWDLRNSLWARRYLDTIDDPSRRQTLKQILSRFESADLPLLKRQPCQAIHNDMNDYNLLVTSEPGRPERLSGIIDFGDALHAPVLCDLAITGAYAILDQERPVEAIAALVEGFVAHGSLEQDQVASLWNLVLTRLAVSVVNASIVKKEKPFDPYVTISEQPAWRILDHVGTLSPQLVHARLRRAAGLGTDSKCKRILSFLDEHRRRLQPLFAAALMGYTVVDMSVAGRHAPDNPLATDIEQFHRIIDDVRNASPGPVLGRYREPRLICSQFPSSSADHPASGRPTVHIGIDIFLTAGDDVHAPLDGVTRKVAYQAGPTGHGGLVVLEHHTDGGDIFFSLYAHLAASVVESLSPGQRVTAGSAFATIGGRAENGGWPAHLHLQLGVMEEADFDWPAAVNADDFDDWRVVFPNPMTLLGLSDPSLEAGELDTEAEAKKRASLTAPNLKLSYASPVPVLRGWKQFLFDDRGRCYLDAYNNVPHVGHSHPRITEAVSRQIRLVNTNTRYLQPAFQHYAQKLTQRLPEPLDVCFLTNSGSEANELAIRLARNFTGADDVVVSRNGYHGHTGVATDLSEYKFNGKGGNGKKEWVHVAEMPDPYRGRFGRENPRAGELYAVDVERLLNEVEAAGGRTAAFISEPFPSVGGQIVPPDGYLQAVYGHIRAKAGLCIADEVQTGLGRLGCFDWGFQQQQVIPDIVVLGKPIGNGYPLAAVVTTRKIADAFANGMEFFSTFGGSTLSCVVGSEVLSILDDECLARNAQETGAYLLNGLRALSEGSPIMGDVRGIGLFIGVEIVDLDNDPATELARYIVNRLREHRILVGSDGPYDNVLKIRPPLCFNRIDADFLLEKLHHILKETPLCL